MQDETGKLDFRIAFKTQDGVDDVVQAVSLAGGAGTGADHLVHIRVVLADRVDVGLGLCIVGVGANENLIVLVIDGRGGQARHFAYYTDFIPRRNHDRQRLFADGVEPLFIGALEFLIVAPAADQLAGPVDDVDEQVIEAQHEHQQSQGNCEVFEAEEHICEEIDQAQTHAPLPATARCLSHTPSRLAIRSLAWPSP
ncbi:hypothetical protein D3C73_543920 [compost metagenome]